MSLYSPGITNLSTKTLTFTGAAGLGAIGNCTLFTITGKIHVVAIDATVKTTVGVDGGTGAASLSLGVTGSTVLFSAAVVATTLTTTAALWYTTATAGGIALPAAYKDISVMADIVAAVTSSGTQKVTSGALEVTLLWVPISSTGAVS